MRTVVNDLPGKDTIGVNQISVEMLGTLRGDSVSA